MDYAHEFINSVQAYYIKEICSIILLTFMLFLNKLYTEDILISSYKINTKENKLKNNFQIWERYKLENYRIEIFISKTVSYIAIWF